MYISSTIVWNFDDFFLVFSMYLIYRQILNCSYNFQDIKESNFKFNVDRVFLRFLMNVLCVCVSAVFKQIWPSSYNIRDKKDQGNRKGPTPKMIAFLF
jgi:hypothetical protein